MWTTEDHTVAAGHSVIPASWQTGLEELLGRVARRFRRVEPRRHARAFVLGLLADLPRKNCWTIAEHAGQATPDGMQHLLAGAVWDEHAVRDDIRDYLVEHLGDPAAVLVVDETGDLKKGTGTVGVGRRRRALPCRRGARPAPLRPQAGAGQGDAATPAGRGGAGPLGDRR